MSIKSWAEKKAYKYTFCRLCGCMFSGDRRVTAGKKFTAYWFCLKMSSGIHQTQLYLPWIEKRSGGRWAPARDIFVSPQLRGKKENLLRRGRELPKISHVIVQWASHINLQQWTATSTYIQTIAVISKSVRMIFPSTSLDCANPDTEELLRHLTTLHNLRMAPYFVFLT